MCRLGLFLSGGDDVEVLTVWFDELCFLFTRGVEVSPELLRGFVCFLCLSRHRITWSLIPYVSLQFSLALDLYRSKLQHMQPNTR